MTAIDYLSEDGSGTYGRWYVPDLVPVDRAVELVFVFESPHVAELRAGLPVVGAAGKSALRFISCGQPKGSSLGRFVQQSHAAGDDRLAILNVSNVPMQKTAFNDAESPDLGEEEWALIEKVRRSRARSLSSMRGTRERGISDVLVDGLRRQLSGVATDSEGRVVAAGTFAQRMAAAACPDLTPSPLSVPHPSFNQWIRIATQRSTDQYTMRDRFVGRSSTAQRCEPLHGNRPNHVPDRYAAEGRAFQAATAHPRITTFRGPNFGWPG